MSDDLRGLTLATSNQALACTSFKQRKVDLWVGHPYFRVFGKRLPKEVNLRRRALDRKVARVNRPWQRNGFCGRQ